MFTILTTVDLYDRNARGPNIGLISSLCVHAKVNSNGILETSFIEEVKDGKAEMSRRYCIPNCRRRG